MINRCGNLKYNIFSWLFNDPNANDKNDGAMPPLLNISSRHRAELIKDRANFIFSLLKDAVNIETV
jgi:hypothetical protein